MRPIRPDMHQRLLPLLAVLAVAGCDINKNSMVAPSTAQLTITPQVDFVERNSTVSFTVQVQEDGGPVPDGTEVVFGAAMGTVDQIKVRTRNGVAQANYTAGSQAGTGRVTVTSGELQSAIEFTVNRPVGRVVMAANRYELPHGGGEVEVIATVMSAENEPLEGMPVTFQTSAGTLGTTGVVRTNAEGQARTTLQTTTAANVQATSLNVQSEGLAITVRAPIAVAVTAEPISPRVGEPLIFTVSLTAAGQPASGNLVLNTGDGRLHNFGTVNGTATLPHTYGQPGAYDVTATLTAPDGSVTRESIRVEVQAAPTPAPPQTPDPGPNPSPNPGPEPPPPSAGNEPIDLSQVVWLHTNVSNWRVTSQITAVSIGDPPICISHTKAGRWPVRDGVEGNPWIFVNRNGTWYAATYEWLRPGQTCKNISASNIGGHIKKPPLENWRPRSGETVGLMVSALARSGQQTVAERSNIVLVRWP
ncbi:MAG TPA: Ig-like domain-containing protein [Vicinamibacterales bacterium]